MIIAGFGSVNWRRRPLFTKQCIDDFYPMNSVELQPLVHENENVQQRTVYEPEDSQLQVLYDAGYPPLPDAVGTEV